MAETIPSTSAGALAQLLNICKGESEKLFESFPEERRMTPLAESKATPLWIVGHMGFAVDFLGNMMALSKPGILPEKYRQRFTPPDFGGDSITTDLGDYPAWDELVELYGKVMGSFADSIAAASQADLEAAPEGPVPEPLQKMLTSLHATANIMIIHDSHHRGQLAIMANLPS